MDEDVAEQAEQRSEIHFLAALVYELMRTMLDACNLTRAQLNDVERVAAEKAGQMPRAW